MLRNLTLGPLGAYSLVPLESDGAHWRFNRSVAASSTCPAARRDGCHPGSRTAGAPRSGRAAGSQAITQKGPQTQTILLDPRNKLLKNKNPYLVHPHCLNFLGPVEPNLTPGMDMSHQ